MVGILEAGANGTGLLRICPCVTSYISLNASKSVFLREKVGEAGEGLVKL